MVRWYRIVKFRAAWVVQAPVGFVGNASEMDAACPEFDKKQHVVAAKHDGVDGEEVAGDDPGRLSTQERRP
jgi:hypothetical protein